MKLNWLEVSDPQSAAATKRRREFRLLLLVHIFGILWHCTELWHWSCMCASVCLWVFGSRCFWIIIIFGEHKLVPYSRPCGVMAMCTSNAMFAAWLIPIHFGWNEITSNSTRHAMPIHRPHATLKSHVRSIDATHTENLYAKTILPVTWPYSEHYAHCVARAKYCAAAYLPSIEI